MENNNNGVNENINNANVDPYKVIKDLFNQEFESKKLEEQKRIDQEKFEQEKKLIEAEKVKLEEQKKVLEENSKKFFDDVKNKIPKVESLANKFKDNSDLQDGVGFLSALSSLIEDDEFTPEELTAIVKNKMTDEDFSKFKSTDDASKITYKLMKICSKYKEKAPVNNTSNPNTHSLKTTNNKNEAEQPLTRRDPSHYQNSMFTATDQMKEFYDLYRKK
jgi:hypothetical protein